jgi:hypothetical protein
MFEVQVEKMVRDALPDTVAIEWAGGSMFVSGINSGTAVDLLDLLETNLECRVLLNGISQTNEFAYDFV